MEILNLQKTPHETVLSRVSEVLAAGGLIIFPTETTYGLGADATNPAAIEKLLAYKSNRLGKALSIAVADQAMAEQYVEINSTAQRIFREFLPGPVTVVGLGKHHVAPGVESETGTLGVRLSSYPLVREMVEHYGKPMTATSANASNEKRPYTLEDIFARLSDNQKSLVDVALDAGELPRNEPSTVVDTTLDSYTVIREGNIRFADSVRFDTHSADETQDIGYKLANRYKSFIGERPVIFALEGEMGAGKTQFVKGLALGLGISEMITSPTYTLMHEYTFTHEGEIRTLAHIDAWRMQSNDELRDLGFPALLQTKAVIALEWAKNSEELIADALGQAKLIWLRLEYGNEVDERHFTLSDKPLLAESLA